MRSMTTGGSTNIYSALSSALSVDTVSESTNQKANIIFFLTDGEPNSGKYTNWNQIREKIGEKNKFNYVIFSLAVGSGAPFSDLEKLSIQNDGNARQIFSDVDVADQIQDFYSEFAVPLIWNAQIKYSNVNRIFATTDKLFEGEEMVIVGKLQDSCSFPKPNITATSTAKDLNDPFVLTEDPCED